MVSPCSLAGSPHGNGHDHPCRPGRLLRFGVAVGRPVAVGGGVVLAASYEAKAFGVQSVMPGWKARELCPELIFVSGHFHDYQRLGDAVMAVLGDFTPAVERMSIDEAFADVAGTE